MTDFILRAISERRTGLALHYAFIHAAVHSLAARRTFEFGAGGSTRVFVEALPSNGYHVSVSTESRITVAEKAGIALEFPQWEHFEGQSDAHRNCGIAALDLALHDGSHAADVVARDIAWVWPYLRRFGLLLVHDTQHSYVGAEVRAGLNRGLTNANARFSKTTLPWGFGLTIVRREDGEHSVEPICAKPESPHTTELTTET